MRVKLCCTSNMFIALTQKVPLAMWKNYQFIVKFDILQRTIAKCTSCYTYKECKNRHCSHVLFCKYDILSLPSYTTRAVVFDVSSLICFLFLPLSV